MLPDSLLGLTLFALFVAPGALFRIIVATRRPQAQDTTFSEVNWVVLVSTLSTALALPVALAPRLFEPRWLGPLLDALRQGGDHWRIEPFPVVLGVAATWAAALIVAGLLAVAWTRIGPGGDQYNESQLYLVFRRKLPKESRPYVIAVAANGDRHYGHVVAYSPDYVESAARDLTLGAPIYRKPFGKPRRPLGGVQRLVLSGDQVVQLHVMYEDVPPPERRRRRLFPRPRQD